MDKYHRKERSYSRTYRNYLILISSVVIFFFMVIIIVFDINKFSSDSYNLRNQIYKEKQTNIKNQVETAENILKILKDSLEDRMHANLKARVDEAYDIALNLYNLHKGKFSDNQIQYMIKEALRPLRFFDGRGYFFIISKDGIIQLHPLDISIEGTSCLNIKNSDGEYPIREIVRQSKLRNENLITYSWQIPGEDRGYTNKKTSYTRNLPFYGWMVGTGDYLKYQEDEVKIQALSKIGEIKYDEYGYIYVYELSGKVLLTHDKAIAKNTNLLNLKDADAKLLFPLIVHNAFKDDGGYFSYRQFINKKDEVRKQQSYVKYIHEWEWIIGGFADMDTVEDLIKLNRSTLFLELYTSLFLILLFIIILAIGIWWFSIKVKNKIENGFNSFYNDFELAVQTHSYLEEDENIYVEQREFTKGINSLLKINNSNILELEQREKELLILNASKDRFFSIIAHDLKNPFNSLIGVLEILLEDYDSLDNNERKEYLKVLNNSSNKLFKLLLELLQWARLQTSGIDCIFTKLNIAELVEKEVNNLDGQRSDKKIEIKLDIPSNLIVEADENMMATVIRNLISNAIKFTNIKGEIKIYSSQEDNKLRLYIQDNGVGMSAEILSKLFKIEEKITSVGTNQEVGTGLGLILCKEFIEKNNGEINVSSELGKGSIFSFTVPFEQVSVIF